MLINAFVAIEDSRFFEHNGFDLPRFTKAIIENIITFITAFGIMSLMKLKLHLADDLEIYKELIERYFIAQKFYIKDFESYKAFVFDTFNNNKVSNGIITNLTILAL